MVKSEMAPYLKMTLMMYINYVPSFMLLLKSAQNKPFLVLRSSTNKPSMHEVKAFYL